MDKGPLEGEGIKIGVEGHQIRGNSHDRGYSRRGRPPDGNGGPPDRNGGPLEMDEIQDTLEDEDHQVHQDLLDQ